LEQAGWLAGVLSAFVALATLAMLLYDWLRSQPGSQLPPESTPGPESGPEPAGGPAVGSGSVNIFRDATNVGPVVMGRDISGPVISGSPATLPPPRSTRAESATPPSASGSSAPGGEATVFNTFSGGFNQGPVVMGRDISGPVTSLLGSSHPAPPGGRQPEQQNPDELGDGE
jgi:hypothetical protein